MRNVSILICTILIALTLVAGVSFKKTFIESLVKKSTEDKVKAIAGSYNNNVWTKFSPVIKFLNNKPTNEWETYSQFTNLQRSTENSFNVVNCIKSVVYNEDLKVIYSSSDHNIMPRESFLGSVSIEEINDALKSALDGKLSSIVMMKAYVGDLAKDDAKSIITVFAPVTAKIQDNDNPSNNNNNGVIEFSFDISDIVRNLEMMQFIVIFTIIVSLISFTTIILIVSKRAEVILEKQQEASMEMAAAKAAAEGESRSKSQFLANVSHELRTPLNAIIGFSEIIESESMGPLGNDQYKDFIKDIHISGVHLLSLINDILDFSKAEEDKLQVDFEQVDLTKLLKICTRMVLPRAEEAKVNFIDEIPKEHFVLLADPKRMKQVILNLFSNAVKFTQENGTVNVKVWRDVDANSILIEIRDTGVGMAAQDLARALAPFGQVDNKLSRRYEGTGLGLPLTKKLVELMRGKFDIKSEVGLGTTITLNFPLPTDSIEADDSFSYSSSKPKITQDITHPSNTDYQKPSDETFNQVKEDVTPEEKAENNIQIQASAPTPSPHQQTHAHVAEQGPNNPINNPSDSSAPIPQQQNDTTNSASQQSAGQTLRPNEVDNVNNANNNPAGSENHKDNTHGSSGLSFTPKDN